MTCDAMSDTDGIRLLMQRAFEQAFATQIGNLYRVYITNAPTVEAQRKATARGIESAVAAYRLAVEAVASWKG